MVQLLTLPAAIAVVAFFLGVIALLTGLWLKQQRLRQAGIAYLVSSTLICLPTFVSQSITPLELLQQASRIFSADETIQAKPDRPLQQPPSIAPTWLFNDLLIENSEGPSTHQATEEHISFRLNSDPTGAQVLIDGEVRGQTPLSLEFAVGSHIRYRIEKPAPETAPEAYEPFEAEIELLEPVSISVWLNRLYPRTPP